MDTASEWVLRWVPLIERGPVLDVACGGGRHAVLFAERGFEVFAVDRDEQVLPGSIHFVKANLEDGSPWPFEGRKFAAIVVTNYLHRPLFPILLSSLDRGGVLVYETFMAGNERYGRPSNPHFLLRPDELLDAFRPATVVAFEQGEVERPKRAVVQRICVIRERVGSVRIDK